MHSGEKCALGQKIHQIMLEGDFYKRKNPEPAITVHLSRILHLAGCYCIILSRGWSNKKMSKMQIVCMVSVTKGSKYGQIIDPFLVLHY